MTERKKLRISIKQKLSQANSFEFNMVAVALIGGMHNTFTGQTTLET
uniref:Uncharacterized protein n=1 Tax=Rhizophora mucronata TaxID=61149 RepID=A0A2P2QN18_RHIMU